MENTNATQDTEYLKIAEHEPRLFRIAERCALAVIGDIVFRKRFDEAWMNTDMPLRKEILEAWTKAILTELNAACAT